MVLNFEKECAEVTKILNLKYAAYISDKKFTVEAHIKNDGLYITFILSNESRSFYYPAEARTTILSTEGQKVILDKFYAILDYLDYYFEEYFKNEDFISLPIDWTDYNFENVEFQLKGQILDLEKEEMADKWLKQSQGSHH